MHQLELRELIWACKISTTKAHLYAFDQKVLLHLFYTQTGDDAGPVANVEFGKLHFAVGEQVDQR